MKTPRFRGFDENHQVPKLGVWLYHLSFPGENVALYVTLKGRAGLEAAQVPALGRVQVILLPSLSLHSAQPVFELVLCK